MSPGRCWASTVVSCSKKLKFYSIFSKIAVSKGRAFGRPLRRAKLPRRARREIPNRPKAPSADGAIPGAAEGRRPHPITGGGRRPFLRSVFYAFVRTHPHSAELPEWLAIRCRYTSLSTCSTITARLTARISSSASIGARNTSTNTSTSAPMQTRDLVSFPQLPPLLGQGHIGGDQHLGMGVVFHIAGCQP